MKKQFKGWTSLSISLLYMRRWRHISSVHPGINDLEPFLCLVIILKQLLSCQVIKDPLQASVTSSAFQELKINTLGRVWEFLVIKLIYEAFLYLLVSRMQGGCHSRSG